MEPSKDGLHSELSGRAWGLISLATDANDNGGSVVGGVGESCHVICRHELGFSQRSPFDGLIRWACCLRC